MIQCYAFDSVPPFAQGLVRDLRVRWALQEAGLAYGIKLVGDRPGSMSPSTYRGIQPFGQIPAVEDGGLTLFESGAIVLRIGEGSSAVLPTDTATRTLAIQWMFAALNTIEPAVQGLAVLDLFHPGEEWAKKARPGAEEAVRRRLSELAGCLKGRDHLAGPFSGADILMTSVLRILRHTDLLDQEPVLVAYKRRCEGRAAFEAALSGQMADLAA